MVFLAIGLVLSTVLSAISGSIALCHKIQSDERTQLKQPISFRKNIIWQMSKHENKLYINLHVFISVHAFGHLSHICP